MSSFAVARDRYDRQAVRRIGGWARDYLRRATLVDFGCAIAGVFAAVQLRFGSDVTAAYIVLSLALPVLWLAAVWLSAGHHVRCLKPTTAFYRHACHGVMEVRSVARLYRWEGGYFDARTGS